MTDKWVARYRWHMQSIPGLIQVCRESSTGRVQAFQYDRPRISGSGDDAPLPFEAQGADDADQLWAQLVLYATEVAEKIGGSSPHVLRTAVWCTSEAQGFRAGVSGTTAALLAADVTTWLVDRAELIGTLDLDDAEEVLFSQVRALRRQYGLEDRPGVNRRYRCPLCRYPGVVATWADVAGREVCQVSCLTCGWSGGEDADLPTSGETGSQGCDHDQALEA
jgi:hypothetical protein